jgi:hypothetical protein
MAERLWTNAAPADRTDLMKAAMLPMASVDLVKARQLLTTVQQDVQQRGQSY